jgi:hypothetical protein
MRLTCTQDKIELINGYLFNAFALDWLFSAAVATE